MQNTGSIQISRSQDARVVRLNGKGTYTQSECFHQLVHEMLQQPSQHVIIDLNLCEYLDSTFLGCLVRLCREHNSADDTRFVVAATAEKQRQLFASNQLHKYLQLNDEPVVLTDPWSDVEVVRPNAKSLGRHVMQCHRTIGELDVPDADKFTKIADDLDAELPPES